MTREELIQSAKKLYDSEWPNEILKEALEETFPELKESEDERIRKALIQFLTNIKDISESGRTSWAVRRDDAEMCNGFLAYLEKQKEQKELPLMDGNADLYFDEWNQQKQNPTKRQCFEEGMRYAEKLQKEQKLVDLSEMMVHKEPYIAPAPTPIVADEQKPTEWSEEDERMRKAVLDEIEHQIEIMPDADDMDSDDQDRYNELISMSVWMKDLPKCMKPHWKPREEQMEVFGNFVLPYGTAHEKIVLNGLYNELKKL